MLVLLLIIHTTILRRLKMKKGKCARKKDCCFASYNELENKLVLYEAELKFAINNMDKQVHTHAHTHECKYRTWDRISYVRVYKPIPHTLFILSLNDLSFILKERLQFELPNPIHNAFIHLFLDLLNEPHFNGLLCCK